MSGDTASRWQSQNVNPRLLTLQSLCPARGGALGGGLLWALTDTRNGGEQKTVHWPPEHPVSPKPAPHKGSLCEVPWNVPW